MIELSDALRQHIIAEAEKAYPDECCGFIFGSMDAGLKRSQLIEPCRNAYDESERFHRFIITPEQMMKAELFARKNKLDIIGFYHSHPDCQAVPSEFDRSHALPVYSYIIASVKQGRADSLLSWELDPEHDYTVFCSEELHIT